MDVGAAQRQAESGGDEQGRFDETAYHRRHFCRPGDCIDLAPVAQPSASGEFYTQPVNYFISGEIKR